MKILYLYAEVMGYTMATIKALVEAGAEVHVVHWDKQKKTSYKAPALKRVSFHPRSRQTLVSMRKLVNEINPDITVVSGWQDRDYLSLARTLRKEGCVVVCGLDGQWHGKPRQYLAAGLGLAGYFSRFFTHAWVAGAYQYEYARKLGFQKKDIVFDLYSADLERFSSSGLEVTRTNDTGYPHRFLFVGRFEEIKGLDTLLSAWRILEADRGDWEMHLIGNGSLKEVLVKTPGVVVKDFMQPDQLVNEISSSGCFVLPSRREPWGVVVHEFAAAGLPLVVSDVVGAAAAFLIHGLNGYRFKSQDPRDLAEKMRNIIRLTDRELKVMSNHSQCLATKITPKTSAANLLSVLQT